MARLAAAAVTVGGVIAVWGPSAPAQSPTPPINDNYLQSLELNKLGTKLNRTDTLVDNRDTSAAGVQADIFNPPKGGGPAEVTSCMGVQYGKTIWYDFYPDAAGVVRLRTAGFDNVIALYPFDPRTLLPDVAHVQCIHQSSAPAEELLASVTGGGAYTVQIGGVNSAGGPLQFQFDYIPNPPHRISADATLKARALGTGIQIISLSVSAPRGTRVEARCSRGCRSQVQEAKTVSFPRLGGARLTAGSKLQIYVTAPRSIGAYIQYKIKPGNFVKSTACLKPGSRKPRNSCH